MANDASNAAMLSRIRWQSSISSHRIRRGRFPAQSESARKTH